MKNKKISIKILGILLLVGIIVVLSLVSNNNKNTNISKQETSKEQLTKTTDDNAYIVMSEHLKEGTKTFMPIEFCAGSKMGAYNYTLYKNKGCSKINVYGLDVNTASNTIELIISGGTSEDNMTEIFNETYSGISKPLVFLEALSIDISSYEFVKITTGVSNAYGRLVTLDYEIE